MKVPDRSLDTSANQALMLLAWLAHLGYMVANLQLWGVRAGGQLL